MLLNYLQEMLPAPLALLCPQSKLPQGAKSEPNLLIFFPAAADQVPFPSTASPHLCKPSPAAQLIAKHLLHHCWRQSRQLQQAQLCALARPAAASQLYFRKTLSNATLLSMGRTPTWSQDQQSQLCPHIHRPGALCMNYCSQRDTSMYRHKHRILSWVRCNLQTSQFLASNCLHISAIGKTFMATSLVGEMTRSLGSALEHAEGRGLGMGRTPHRGSEHR